MSVFQSASLKSITRFSFMLILTLLTAAASLAQSRTGAVHGTVTDSSGAAISRARIIMRNASGFVAREAVSNQQGEFVLAELAAGEYQISIEADGLSQNGAQKITVNEAQTNTVTIKLQVAAIRDTLIVSATRTQIIASETPASVHVISADDLQRSQRASVLDALRASPGVNIAQTARRGGLTSLFVRGGESDYTKVLIDGVPANDAGGAFDFSDLTTVNVERVELVRGAQSALYGSDAMTGALQFITRRGATKTPELEIEGEGGSFAFNRQSARLAGAGGQWDYSFGFMHLRTNGRGRNDDYQNRTASANIGWQASQRTQLRFNVRNENSGLGVPGTTAFYFSDPDERARRRRITASVRADDQTARNWHQSVSFVFAENDQQNFDPAAQDLSKPNTPPDTSFAFNDFTSFFSNHQRRRALRYQSDLALPANNLLSAGVEWEQERAVFVSGFSGRDRNAPARRNIGFFVQDQFAVAGRALLTAGLRVENNQADLPAAFVSGLAGAGSVPFTGTTGFGTKLVPRIAAMIVLHQSGTATTKLRTGYGEGIKAATLVEAFSPSPFFLGNPGLKPERARSFDVGIEQLLASDRLQVEAVYFENRFRDQIVFVSDAATFGPIKLSNGLLTSFINTDRAQAHGLELGISARPVRRIRFGSNYTLTNSEITLSSNDSSEIGRSLLRRPKHYGSFHAAWLGEKLEANIAAIFTGKRRDLNPVTFSREALNKGYTKVDVSSAYRINSQITFFARIENLLNQDFQEVLGYPAYRLNFAAGLRFRFGGAR